ncbi:siderophore-interacting protein [Streptomyces lavendulae]|uniref:siderophore-interacting protein n=1 Tax=Streptomyces lavendulae TaxID=1914 RepID=UPI0033D1C1FC
MQGEGADRAVGKGWEGVVLKPLRGEDFTFTVTGAEEVTEHVRRVHFTDGGLPAALGTSAHPTMWVRAWFGGGGRPHQRAYTLVDPDPAAGTFAFQFVLHDGLAGRWALGSRPGDTLEATVRFETQHPSDARLPVRAGAAPRDVRRVPRGGTAPADRVRAELPELLGPDPAAAYVWPACGTAATRALRAYLPKDLGLPKQRVHALGYRRPA